MAKVKFEMQIKWQPDLSSLWPARSLHWERSIALEEGGFSVRMWAFSRYLFSLAAMLPELYQMLCKEYNVNLSVAILKSHSRTSCLSCLALAGYGYLFVCLCKKYLRHAEVKTMVYKNKWSINICLSPYFTLSNYEHGYSQEIPVLESLAYRVSKL